MQNQTPKNWQKVKLGEVAVVNMGQSPSSAFYNVQGEGLPFYQGVTDFGEKYPTPTMYCSQPAKTAELGTALFSVRAPVGDVNIANEEACIGRGVASISMINGNNDFLYFLLKNQEGYFKAISGGTTYESINKDQIEDVEVVVPTDPKDQKKVASILSAFDEKIEVNNKIAKTLEEMAQALFREWFSKIEGKEYSLLDVADFINGGAFGRIINKNKKGLPLIKIAELNRGLTDNTEWVDKKVADKYYIKDGDLLFSWSGSLGVYIWNNGQGVLNQHIFNVLPKSGFPLGFVYFLLKAKVRIFQHTAGAKATTMGHIKKEHLRDESVFIPAGSDLKTFNTFYQQIVNLKLENQKLVALRNLLLPKLMKGKIRV